MDSPVVVAGIGFVAALISVWLTAYFQTRSDRAGRILEARLRVYGDCADSLFEYSRGTYNRSKTRIEGMPEVARDPIRQEAFRLNARARSTIGQVHILTGDQSLEQRLSRVRHDIGRMNDAKTEDDLKSLQNEIYEELKRVLVDARHHLST